MKETQRFNSRAFVVFGMLASGMGLPVTGLANHIQQFESMNAARHAWMAAHNSLGFLFVVFSAWHVVLNRKTLLNHLKGWAACAPVRNREAIAAGAVVAILFFACVGHAFLPH